MSLIYYISESSESSEELSKSSRNMSNLFFSIYLYPCVYTVFTLFLEGRI